MLKEVYCLFFLLFILGCKDGGYNSPAANDIVPEEKTSSSDQYLSDKKELEILRDKTSDSLTIEKLFELGNSFYLSDRSEEFKEASLLVLKKAVEKKDTVSIAKSYRYLAEYYKSVNKNDSAYVNFLKAEKFYLKLKDNSNYAKTLLKKGVVQFYGNAYLEADLSVTQAYNLLKNSDDKQLVYQAVSMIGIIATELRDYNKAIEYHTRALQIVEDYGLDNDLNQKATTLNNLGNVYQNINDNIEAIKNFNKALANKKKLQLMPELYARLLDNLAYSKLKIKDTTGVESIFLTALRIRDSLNLKSGMILSKIHLSEFYYQRNDTINAQKYVDEALALSQKTQIPTDRLLSLRQASTVNHRNSSKYYSDYILLNDSLQQMERRSRDKFTRIQLETDEISSEKDKLEQQNRNLFYFFVGILMIGMLLFVIRTQRAKNRELLLKQAQQKANEDIYNLMISQQNAIEESRSREKKRIAQELHDGILGRLFGARLNLDSLNKQNSQEALEKRNEYLAELKNIEQDIREISHDLNREKYVLINNFIAILNDLIEEQRNSFAPNLKAIIDDSIKWESLENTAKINLYRIIQESLQNINKYSNAKNVKIEIKRAGENLILNVADDGDGFTLNNKKKGIGLQNMISRAHELNGNFDIRSKKGKGTTIYVSFPFETKQTSTV